MQETRSQLEITQKIQTEMKQAGLDVLVLTKAESILYATGFASKFAYMMQSPGVSTVVIPASGSAVLVINDFEEGTAKIQAPEVKVESYSTWMYIHDEDHIPAEKNSSSLNMNQSFDLVIGLIRSCGANLRVGVEAASLTWDYRSKLNTALSDMEIVDGTPALMKARKIKTRWEIETLRRATHIAEETMKLTAQQFTVGMTSADLLNLYSRNAFSLDKHVIDVFLAQGIGSHYSAVWIPNSIPSQSGNIVMTDGGVNYYGYRSDIARTFCLGMPSATQEKIFHALYAGFSAGLELLKPGVPFIEVFRAAQSAVQKNGLPYYTRGHVGHSIGVGIGGFVEEAPFIAPDEDSILEPNMVISFECPCYGKDGSFNIEDSFLITETGYERFSTANDSLCWPQK